MSARTGPAADLGAAGRPGGLGGGTSAVAADAAATPAKDAGLPAKAGGQRGGDSAAGLHVIHATDMRLWYWLCQCLVRAAFVGLFRGRVLGRRNVPREGGALLVSNHQSYFDPVLVAMAVDRETSQMARDSLFPDNWFGKLNRACNAFPVKRGSADLGAIKEGIRRLKAGGLLSVFPEGTRTRDGSVGKMHAGVLLMARKARVPIVPVMLMGVYDVLPRDAKFPRLRPITIAFGEALRVEEMKGLSDEACMEVVRGRIVGMMGKHGRARALA